jgi:hypothetical protein
MASALTRFGQICRDIRIKHGKSMGDQAEALACEVHYISSIETGKVAPPPRYIEGLKSWLNLDHHEYLELMKRGQGNVIPFPARHMGGNNSTSMRLFRKISRMDPTSIRSFREKLADEAKDDR